MADIIIIAVLVVLITAAVLYIHKAKKSGKACIGCPSSGGCHSCNCKSEKKPGVDDIK